MIWKISKVLNYFFKNANVVQKQLHVNYNCRSLLTKCFSLSRVLFYRNCVPFVIMFFSHYNNFFCALQWVYLPLISTLHWNFEKWRQHSNKPNFLDTASITYVAHSIFIIRFYLEKHMLEKALKTHFKSNESIKS